jgi:hypothetical protein
MNIIPCLPAETWFNLTFWGDMRCLAMNKVLLTWLVSCERLSNNDPVSLGNTLGPYRQGSNGTDPGWARRLPAKFGTLNG